MEVKNSMGGRGSGSKKRRGGGSSDGVFEKNTKTKIETIFREGRYGSKSYYKDEVLEAETDGKGNVTFQYARGGKFEKTSITNRTNYVTFNLKAGAVNGETFNINWNNVKSISGQTYNLRQQAKENGMKWNGKEKRWEK